MKILVCKASFREGSSRMVKQIRRSETPTIVEEVEVRPHLRPAQQAVDEHSRSPGRAGLNRKASGTPDPS